LVREGQEQPIEQKKSPRVGAGREITPDTVLVSLERTSPAEPNALLGCAAVPARFPLQGTIRHLES
jgi:hypothetical protein